jgi:hypothetical protein
VRALSISVVLERSNCVNLILCCGDALLTFIRSIRISHTHRPPPPVLPNPINSAIDRYPHRCRTVGIVGYVLFQEFSSTYPSIVSTSFILLKIILCRWLGSVQYSFFDLFGLLNAPSKCFVNPYCLSFGLFKSTDY